MVIRASQAMQIDIVKKFLLIYMSRNVLADTGRLDNKPKRQQKVSIHLL